MFRFKCHQLKIELLFSCYSDMLLVEKMYNVVIVTEHYSNFQ